MIVMRNNQIAWVANHVPNIFGRLHRDPANAWRKTGLFLSVSLIDTALVVVENPALLKTTSFAKNSNAPLGALFEPNLITLYAARSGRITCRYLIPGDATEFSLSDDCHADNFSVIMEEFPELGAEQVLRRALDAIPRPGSNIVTYHMDEIRTKYGS